jgi:tetratricopeptide (TPR) repeat protein
LNGRWPDEPNPLNDPLFERAVPQQARRRGPLPREDRLPVIKPSTPEAQRRSLRQLAAGDQQFKAGRYLSAAQAYRQAIADAEDLPDNYFRLAIALTELRRYDDAIDQIKYGLLLDPTWPQRGQPLIDYFRVGANFEKTSMLHRVGDWVRGDLRNPDRIFLLAVLLHFDGDRENSRKLIESAMRVAGEESYLTAFLANDEQPAVDQEQPADGAVPEPPAAGVNLQKAAPPAKQPVNDSGTVPKREAVPPEETVTPPEAFPNLKAPALPGSSEPANAGESKIVPNELTGT